MYNNADFCTNKIKYAVFLFIISVLLVSCSAENDTLSNAENDASIVESGALSDVDASDLPPYGGVAVTGSLSKERIVITYDNKPCTYFGKKVDNSNSEYDYDHKALFEKAKNAFFDEYKADNLLPYFADSVELEIDGEVPKSVSWDLFYIDENGEFHYSAPSFFSREARLEDSRVVIPVGSDLLYAADSSVEHKKVYRLIRIACEYGDGTTEYFVCFRGRPISNS